MKETREQVRYGPGVSGRRMPLNDWLKTNVLRKGVAIIAAFVTLDVLAIYLMLTFGANNSAVRDLAYDTIRLSIQLLLIVLFGGIFIQEYNRSRARKNAIHEFRRTILKDLSRAYSDAKGVRRILRARCERIVNEQTQRDENCIPLPLYHEHIVTINAIQLELEIMVSELEIIKGVFDNIVALIDHIEEMETYLGRVIAEYETEVGRYRGEVSIPLDALPRLWGFIIKTAEPTSEFRHFSKSYHKALTIIQEERVKV